MHLKIKYFHFAMKKNIFEDKGEDNIRNKNSLINYKKLERLTFSKRRDINDKLVKKKKLFNSKSGSIAEEN